VFFLICSQDDRIHLHVLARLCMMCHHTSLLLELRETTDPHEMHRILVASERQVIPPTRVS
jgi:PTS system nitrogen regulatory IIA component